MRAPTQAALGDEPEEGDFFQRLGWITHWLNTQEYIEVHLKLMNAAVDV